MPPSALRLGYRALMSCKVTAGGWTPWLGPAAAEGLRHRRPMGLVRHPQAFSG
jgi:hypothetical protein